MKTIIIEIDNPNALKIAEETIINDGIVAFPTDTVYGIACLAFNSTSIEILYRLKERSKSKAIALLLGKSLDLSDVSKNVSKKALALANKFWPGPLTLVVPKHENVPTNISPLPTIGVRIPNHKFLIRLINKVGPIAATSANMTGENNAQSAQDVLKLFDGKIDLIIDGGISKGGIPSTVIDTTTSPYEILREGPVTNVNLDPYL